MIWISDIALIVTINQIFLGIIYSRYVSIMHLFIYNPPAPHCLAKRFPWPLAALAPKFRPCLTNGDHLGALGAI